MSLRLLPLVLGAFAIGSETFMISGVLPTIAGDLSVSPSAAGSLVTVFALAYAFRSPLLAVATAGVERKRVLMVAMGGFAPPMSSPLSRRVSSGEPGFRTALGVGRRRDDRPRDRRGRRP